MEREQREQRRNRFCPLRIDGHSQKTVNSALSSTSTVRPLLSPSCTH
jgi:hypothetical protein